MTDSLPPPSIGGEDLEVDGGLRGARRMLAIGGGRGGVGKSLVAQNLAIYLAQLGKNVTLVDLDPTGSNMHTQFGIAAHTWTSSRTRTDRARWSSTALTPAASISAGSSGAAKPMSRKIRTGSAARTPAGIRNPRVSLTGPGAVAASGASSVRAVIYQAPRSSPPRSSR